MKEWILIAVGLFLLALAWKWFLLPNHIAGGGATGISAIVLYATGIPMWVTYAVINIGLLVLAVKTLGWQFLLRTIYGVGCFTLWLALPIEPLATFEPFMSSILGGILGGVGMGIMFSCNGSSGGTDVIAMVVNKYYNISLGRVILCCDVIIISSSYLLPDGSIEKVVYGLIVMATMTYVIDLVVNGNRQAVQFFIISKNYVAIADSIESNLRRGVTVLDGTGWYTKTSCKVITVMTRKYESTHLFRLVKEIDPDAFVSQTAAIGVYGRGFDSVKVKTKKKVTETSTAQ